MTKLTSPSWQNIRDEVFKRISERAWQPGQRIPKETDLATEFGCARATVNRALQQLAEEGLLERRRKGGSRVALHPVRKATIDIPITRLEVEQLGAVHSHRLLAKKILAAPEHVCRRMHVSDDSSMLYLQALHLADNSPFIYEERWVNTTVVPEILGIDFKKISANEWLVQNAVFTRGDIAFSAANTTNTEAKILESQAGQAIFVVERTTWNGQESVTSVRLAYRPGYVMETTI